MRQFLISDIHGCAKTFQKLLRRIRLKPSDQLFLLGDYVNKGPDSKGVIDTILELQQQRFQIVLLRGNHEDMLWRSLLTNQPEPLPEWMRVTPRSFGVEELRDIPELYWKWMDQLQYLIEWDQYILVHAGLNFGVPNPYQDREAMLYARDWYQQIDYNWLGDRKIIHGHIQQERYLIEFAHRHFRERPVLCIDCGCVSKEIPGRGYLCAYELKSDRLYFERNMD